MVCKAVDILTLVLLFGLCTVLVGGVIAYVIGGWWHDR